MTYNLIMVNEIKKPEPQTPEEQQFLQLIESGNVRPEFAAEIVKGMRTTHEAVEKVIPMEQETEKKPETHEESLKTALEILNSPNEFEQKLELLKTKGFDILKIAGYENTMAIISTPSKPNYYYLFTGGKGRLAGRNHWFYDFVDTYGKDGIPKTMDTKISNALSLPEVGDIDERNIRKYLDEKHITGDFISILTRKKGVAEVAEIREI